MTGSTTWDRFVRLGKPFEPMVRNFADSLQRTEAEAAVAVL